MLRNRAQDLSKMSVIYISMVKIKQFNMIISDAHIANKTYLQYSNIARIVT